MSRDNTIQELIDSAERLEANGSLVRALEQWRAVLDREKDVSLLCRFGRVAMKANMAEEARQAFLEAIALDPEFPHAYSYLGIWCRNNGSLEKAIEHFEKSVSIGGTAATYTLLGGAQLQLGRVDEARASFDRAIDIDPNYEEAYYNIGAGLAIDQPKESVTFLRRAVELDPEFAAAHSELGQTLRRLNENTDAEYHLRKAIELDKDDMWAHLYLCNLLWTIGNQSTAEECFKSAHNQWPNSSIPAWCLAMFYDYRGEGERAERFYRQALTIEPGDPEANKRFGIYLSDIGETERARAYLERARALEFVRQTSEIQQISEEPS